MELIGALIAAVVGFALLVGVVVGALNFLMWIQDLWDENNDFLSRCILLVPYIVASIILFFMEAAVEGRRQEEERERRWRWINGQD